uniref:Uncharacterized protein n=1 Tax=Nucleocytoviricota sp. TaxID=2809609 RepID=A0A9E8G5A0_9VIRU|nr:hypothetical protein [Nucleocytoviricota sp.]
MPEICSSIVAISFTNLCFCSCKVLKVSLESDSFLFAFAKLAEILRKMSGFLGFFFKISS